MWDDRYNTDTYIYGTEANQFLAGHTRSLPAEGRILCLAVGEGRNAVYLAKQGYDVTGIDSSSVGLAKACRLAEKAGVKLSLIHADLTDYDLGDETWDAIVSIFFHLPADERTQVYQRAQQALKPGGVLLLEAYTPQQLDMGTGGPKEVERLVTAVELQTDFSGLIFSHLQVLERDVVEGTMHTGRSAVVQAIASKPFTI